jgi:hypothetical protein
MAMTALWLLQARRGALVEDGSQDLLTEAYLRVPSRWRPLFEAPILILNLRGNKGNFVVRKFR